MYWFQHVTIFIIILKTYAENCDKFGTLLYEDLDCTPVYNSKPCPFKYKCENWEQMDSNKCHYNRKSYDYKEVLPDTGDPCNNNCVCDKYYDNTTSIRCPQQACDEIFWLKENCSLTHSFNECCATSTVCAPFENLATCVFNNEKYHEGQRFNLQDSCHDCICQKGFTNKIEKPFCKRRACSIQLQWSFIDKIQKYCAPFYGKVSENDALCCPLDWICPDGSEIFKEASQSDESCRFGNKFIQLGEQIEKRNLTHYIYGRIEKVQCICSLPPLLTCKQI